MSFVIIRVSEVTELEGLLGHTFQLFLQLDEVCCRSGLSAFAGITVSVVGLGSVGGASVFIFAVRNGAKKFFVATFADSLVT
jgi:hypothetical protein